MTFSQVLFTYRQAIEPLTSPTEATLRDQFLHFLRKGFPHLEELKAILLEEKVPSLEVRGRIDALLGKILIEFKRDLGEQARLREGEAQLERYLQHTPEVSLGLLTDGRQLIAYALRDGKLQKLSELHLLTEDPLRVQNWLDAFLFSQPKQKPTAEDFVRRFGLYSLAYLQSERLLVQHWRQRSEDPTAFTKYTQWNALLAIVYGTPVGDEALFLRHTYLSFLARLLAYGALFQKALSPQEVEDFLSGRVFQRLGYPNLAEEDFFTWIEATHPEVQQWLTSLSPALVLAYDLEFVEEDLLKELYQQLVDPSTRHDLGEYYTPDWVAEQVLREAGFPPSSQEVEAASVLDPACGSGTFLFLAVRLLAQKGWSGEQLVRYVRQGIAGMDIHPLAVAIARINLFLALRPHLPQGGLPEPLHLPVYLADALRLPPREDSAEPVLFPIELEKLAEKKGLTPPASVGGFQLPPHYSEHFTQLIEGLLHYSQSRLPDADARQGFQRFLTQKGVPPEDQSWWLQNLRLMRWLLSPPPTDSIWAFLMRNAIMPTYFSRKKFAFVVGNPPWIAYRYLRTREYQKEVARLLKEYHLIPKSQSAHLKTHLEVAVLFFAVGLQRYCKKGGKLAFVMPRSVITGAKHHQPFQEMYMPFVERILDYEQVSPLFNVPSCALIAQALEDEPKGFSEETPSLRLIGLLSSHDLSWEKAQQELTFQETFWSPVTREKSYSFYHDKFRQGTTIVPRTFWFVRPQEHAAVIGSVETDPRILPQAKAPWKDLRLKGRVEREFLYATLLSDDLLPFGWRAFSLIVLPLYQGKLLSSNEALMEGFPNLAIWMREVENYWEKYRKTSDYDLIPYLNWQNKLLAQNLSASYRVLYNTSGTHLAAVVLEGRVLANLTLHGWKVQGFIADTTTYYYETENRDEAHYLCTLLNAPSIDTAIKPYQTKGAFGAQKGKGERHIHRRPFEVVPLPRYDSGNPHHRRLAELSQAAHERVRAFLADTPPEKLPRSIGKLRSRIREHLQDILSQVEAACAAVLAEK
ncbi:MAG: N-6 DNA methylase [Bacteroidia bacterium]|nr:N-6 DNA methylase [Bacteroidia bacterium]